MSGRPVLAKEVPVLTWMCFDVTDTTGRRSPGGALNHLGEMKMGSWQGQHDVWDQSTASSVFSSSQSMCIPSRDSCSASEGAELLHQGKPSAKSHRFPFRITECTGGFKLTHMFSRRTGRNRQWAHGAGPARKRHGLVRELRSVEAAALEITQTNFQATCFVKRHRSESPKWAPMPVRARCQTRSAQPKFLKQEVDCRARSSSRD